MKSMNYFARILCTMLVAMTAVLAAAPADAGQAKPFRIYLVLWRGVTDAERGFMSYFEENHIPAEFVVRDAGKDKTKLAGFIDEIKRVKPDLVYTFGTTVTTVVAGKAGAVDPAKNVTNVPIVFNIVADPLGAGLTKTLSGTGRNLTGTSHSVPLPTQIKAMETLDKFKTVGAIYNPLETNSALAIKQLGPMLEKDGIDFVPVPVPVKDGMAQLDGVPQAVDKLAKAGAQIVYLPSDSFLISNAQTVVQAIHDHGIPTFSATETPIRKAGALIGIVSNYFTVGKFAGYKARQILVDGKKAGSIPIETLAKYTFLVDLDTMKKLDYYPPVPVLQFAAVVGGDEQAAR